MTDGAPDELSSNGNGLAGGVFLKDMSPISNFRFTLQGGGLLFLLLRYSLSLMGHLFHSPSHSETQSTLGKGST